MTKPIDITKPVQTRAGLPVRILATDVKGPYSIVGVVTDADGVEEVHTYLPDGREMRLGESFGDLENVTAKREEFRALYANHDGWPYVLSNAADAEACRITTGTVRDGMGVLRFSYEDDRLVAVELVR